MLLGGYVYCFKLSYQLVLMSFLFLLGDPAYPLLDRLIRGYINCPGVIQCQCKLCEDHSGDNNWKKTKVTLESPTTARSTQLQQNLRLWCSGDQTCAVSRLPEIIPSPPAQRQRQLHYASVTDFLESFCFGVVSTLVLFSLTRIKVHLRRSKSSSKWLSTYFS